VEDALRRAVAGLISSRPNDLVDGWDMLLQNKKGHDYIKPAWFGGPTELVNDAHAETLHEVLASSRIRAGAIRNGKATSSRST